MKLDQYINAAKVLIEAPYNRLNMDNYIEAVQGAFKIKLNLTTARHTGPTSLMSGGHRNALMISNKIESSNKDIILVGKGVLFDAGGYSLKKSMAGMHTDMAGMAIAFAVSTYCQRELKMPNVYAYCPVTTNFIHNTKINIGDIIDIGEKQVEIKNADAEGRLILAEALSKDIYKKKDIVITIATLTGSCEYTVGSEATAVMGAGGRLVKKYLKANQDTDELAWELPLWTYLQKEFDKKVIANLSSNKCGTIMAAMFVKQFVKNINNWIHLDIAASAYNARDKQATGDPMRTLVKFIELI